MKSMKKCRVTENKISIINKLRDRRRSSAGMFYTSSAGAVTSLILLFTLFIGGSVFAASYSITYNDSVISNMPADEAGTTSGSVTLPDNNPASIDRRFTGWCLGTSSSSNITTTGGVDSCSSTTYLPGASLPISQSSADNYLYAMWTNTANVTFNFDSNISSIVVNGKTISVSGSTIALPVNMGYTVEINSPNSTYMVDTAIVNSGDATTDIIMANRKVACNIFVGGSDSVISITSKPKPLITFNIDSGISAVKVDGKTLTQSGAVPLIPNSGYGVEIVWKNGYMLNIVSVASGDSTIEYTDDQAVVLDERPFSLKVGNSDSIVNVPSQTARNVNVSFTYQNIEKIVVDGKSVTASGGKVSLMGGKTYTATVTFSSGYEFGYVFPVQVSSGTYYSVGDYTNNTFTFSVGIDAGAIKIDTMSCITADTLVTLADGTKERVADLKGDEELLVWDFDTASYAVAPITFIDTDPEQEYDIIHVFFSDETDVEVISEHGFYDYTLNKYVYVNENNPEQYIGHEFIMQDGDTYKTVKLTDIKHEKKVTTPYSPVTYKHFNYFTNDMLSMPGGIEGMFNYFEVDKDTMGYDKEKKQADIEKYGLLTLEDFDGLIDELGFEAYNGQYLNIAIGKGLITWDGIKALADKYGHFTAEQLENGGRLEDEKEIPRLLKTNEGAKINTTRMGDLSERGQK